MRLGRADVGAENIWGCIDKLSRDWDLLALESCSLLFGVRGPALNGCIDPDIA